MTIPRDLVTHYILNFNRRRADETTLLFLISVTQYVKELISRLMLGLHVTKEEALRHPSWNMGAKITIDSATLMNKGTEVMRRGGCSIFLPNAWKHRYIRNR